MCGIAGIISFAGQNGLDARLGKMLRVQKHRGPDGEGSRLDRIAGADVALGHLRLAILDLSSAGAQPMVSPCGKHVITFNGEIYNYRELRHELEGLGVSFSSATDTEVLLQALIRWGYDAFAKLNGMWALAWVDKQRRRLTLSRDRFGKKPLYIYKQEGVVYFSSEIKGILEGSGDKFAVNHVAAGHYVQQNILDATNETFFAGIDKLPAGHYLNIPLETGADAMQESQPFWSVNRNQAEPTSESDLIDEVRSLFFDAVKIRLRSDVPVGVLLSGGIDSSAIASAMQQTLGKSANLHIISAVSRDPRYDEQPHIDKMTAYLGSKVHKIELDFTPERALELLDEVTWSNDEPIGSFSTVAHYLLMRYARSIGVTVILSGQGADELLCGYRKYLGFYVQSLLRQGSYLEATRVLSGFVRQGTILPQFTLREARVYIPHLQKMSRTDVRGPRLRAGPAPLSLGLNGTNVSDRQLADVYRFSVPVLTHYEDRMAMAFGREIRLPFLDYRLVDRLTTLQPTWKLRDGWTKWIFRQAMAPYMPSDITWRKDKRGFINPQAEWLKRELRPKMAQVLSEPLLAEKSGFLDGSALRRKYQAYCRQPADEGMIAFREIFHPIAFELWMRRFAPYLNEA